MWACGAVGSALPWHGRGHRFEPDQVHQNFQTLTGLGCPALLRLDSCAAAFCHAYNDVMAKRVGQNGRELNEKWGGGASHALYCKTGDWYHIPKSFPAALFDAHGHLRFATEADLHN